MSSLNQLDTLNELNTMLDFFPILNSKVINYEINKKYIRYNTLKTNLYFNWIIDNHVLNVLYSHTILNKKINKADIKITCETEDVEKIANKNKDDFNTILNILLCYDSGFYYNERLQKIKLNDIQEVI